MREFEAVRPLIEQRLTSSNAAEAWLFETHAVAAGTPPESQYLEYARNCDLYVLVIGSFESAATLAEYHEAFADNPQKILPFFFGPASPEVQEFRDLIDSRHARVATATPEELVGRIGEAADEAIALGTPILQQLNDAYEARLVRAETFIELTVPQVFLPHVVAAGDTPEPQPFQMVAERFSRLVVTGPGGSGKTFASLMQLRHWLNDPLTQSLPLLVRASSDETNALRLIERTFDAVRFAPGEALLERYGRDGRLRLMFDGFDELSDNAQRDYVRSVESMATRFPRCRVLFLARTLSGDHLDGFMRVRMHPLPENVVHTFLESQGYPQLGQWDVPAEVKDLLGWPLWLQMFAKFGVGVGSGLFLLQRLVDYRLSKWNAMEGQKLKTRRAIGQIALESRPGISMPRSRALQVLADWSRSPSISALFESEPAESLIESVLATGLVESEASSLVFIHPLIGSFVAAEAASSQTTVPHMVWNDKELSAFLIPLLTEARAHDVVALLSKHDIFTLARTLRLARASPRSTAFEDDVLRFDKAFSELRSLAGSPTACDNAATVAVVGDPWLALGRTTAERPAVLHAPADGSFRIEDVLPGEYVFWDVSPFGFRTPELVAAGEILAAFKRNFVHIRPPGDPYGDYESVDVKDALRYRRKLRDSIFDFIYRFNAAKTDLADALGLSLAPGIRLGQGDAHVSLIESGSSSRVRVEWGKTSRAFHVSQDDPDLSGYSIQRVLDADPAAAAYEELQREVENEIGSSMNSQAWSKPHLLAEWVW